VLVPPQLGWTADPTPGPPPDTFGAQRRLANNRDSPLLFEAEVVRVTDIGEPGFDVSEYERVRLASPYALPAPPRYGESARGSLRRRWAGAARVWLASSRAMPVLPQLYAARACGS
jgi:hypothetical protein